MARASMGLLQAFEALVVLGGCTYSATMTNTFGAVTIDAARLLTVRLTRKGVSLQGRSHNFALADILLGDTPWP